ncbi:rCG49847, isoform CRA_a [Rattus norvegicus]|uniref:RCG49847, isoform CRA_a n=1 Tax=Rattus norvegicus TaxID=10116 RepID=A6K4L1_RAT|nr:rCG49847, isoform CRA_a [Rattus norvegicus]
MNVLYDKKPGTIWPGAAEPTRRWALPLSITNQGVLVGQSDGGIFSTEVFLSQMTLPCVNLTKS